MPASLQWLLTPQGGLSTFGATRRPRFAPSRLPNGAPPFRNPQIPPTAPQHTQICGGKGLLRPPRGLWSRPELSGCRREEPRSGQGQREGEHSHCACPDPKTRVLPLGAAADPGEPLNHLCDLWAPHLTSFSSYFSSSSSSTASRCTAAKTRTFPDKPRAAEAAPGLDFQGEKKAVGWVESNAGKAWKSARWGLL